jgi:hypothetical protein
MVHITTCSGASHSGNLPAYCSIRMPMNLSKLPRYCTVKHHRPVFFVIAADVVRIQPFRQNKIHLNGAALPVAADSISQHELQLRPIERAFARVQCVLQTGLLPSLLWYKRTFGLIPGRIIHRRAQAAGQRI